MKLEFPQQTWEKYSNTKFHKNTSSGTRVVYLPTDRKTDWHDKANCRFLEFYEPAYNQSVNAAPV